jgi:O-antigen ligase
LGPTAGAVVVAGVLAWTTFAFGGTYTRHLAAPAIACFALFGLYRPAVLARGPAAALDRWLLVVAGAAALQSVPLPSFFVNALSPGVEPVVTALSLAPPEGTLPLTIDRRASLEALVLFCGALALFFCARHIFASGGVRTVMRVLACCGLALALIAVAQDATAHGLMYWIWRPLDEGPYPFGPFVNRNHFGTWAVMVVPLCFGYLMAHATAHRGPRRETPWQRQVLDALDVRGALLLAAAVLLIFAVALSLSRSGVAGLLAAGLSAALFARGRLSEDPRRFGRPALLVAGGAAASILVVLWGIDPSVLGSRFAAAGAGVADRAVIWRDTLSVVRDFWLTGTGIGTFRISMAVYQRNLSGVIFNQAHNHYLQVLAEGGLLVGIPVAAALGGFAREAAQRLALDRSGMFWVRAGAASGLCGVAVQSLLETGLTTPANAALAAVAAAIVVHVTPGPAASRMS